MADTAPTGVQVARAAAAAPVAGGAAVAAQADRAPVEMARAAGVTDVAAASMDEFTTVLRRLSAPVRCP